MQSQNDSDTNNYDKVFAHSLRIFFVEQSNPWTWYKNTSNVILHCKNYIFACLGFPYLYSQMPMTLSDLFCCDINLFDCDLSVPDLLPSGSTIRHLFSRKSVKLATVISSLFLMCVHHSRRIAVSNFAIIKWLITVSHVFALRNSNARIWVGIIGEF